MSLNKSHKLGCQKDGSKNTYLQQWLQSQGSVPPNVSRSDPLFSAPNIFNVYQGGWMSGYVLLRRIGEVRHGVNDHELYRGLSRLYDLEIDISKTDDVGLP